MDSIFTSLVTVLKLCIVSYRTKHSIVCCFCSESIFMVIAGHAESDDLSDDEAYSEKSLTDVVKSQPALQDLIEKNRLVSVGYTHSPTQLCFNSKQRDQIKDWINKDLRSQNLY